MSSLPEFWDTVVAAISSSRGSEKLKFDEIRDVVISENIRKREVGDLSGIALNIDQRGEVRRKAKIYIVYQNQLIEEYPWKDQAWLVGIVEKRAVLDELYKAKEETKN